MRSERYWFTMAAVQRPSPSPLAFHWALDPRVVQLNHGSFGATPRLVLERQQRLRLELEADPTGFLLRRMPGLLERSLEALAAFVGAQPEDLALVANATTGVNTVLRSLELGPGDEILFTDHEYPACRNAVLELCRATRARPVVVPLPFPVGSEDEVVAAVAAGFGERTRLLLVDHVTSPSGLVLPVTRIAAEARARGVPVLVDGAHAPGMVELDIATLGVDWYTGNCHKWLCAPKGAAFLWVRREHRDRLRPLVVSHGASAGDDRFRREFDWTGTFDPTAWLSVPAAIDVVGALLDGGWPAVRQANRELVLAGRTVLCEALGVSEPAPPSMIGSLAAVPLAAGDGRTVPPFGLDPIQDALFERYRIEVPVITWLPAPRRVLRLSAQLYNALDQYHYLAAALGELRVGC